LIDSAAFSVVLSFRRYTANATVTSIVNGTADTTSNQYCHEQRATPITLVPELPLLSSVVTNMKSHVMPSSEMAGHWSSAMRHRLCISNAGSALYSAASTASLML